jgi:hypothetical protein
MSTVNFVSEINVRSIPIELREMLGRWKYWQTNHVESGLVVAAPTTGSAHADAGPFDYNINLSAGMVTAGGYHDEPTAAADVDVAHGAGTAPVGATTCDIIYVIVAVCDHVSHAITYVAVPGTKNTAALVVAPAASVIQAAVGASNYWVRLGTTRIHRSGAAAITQTYTNVEKPRLT